MQNNKTPRSTRNDRVEKNDRRVRKTNKALRRELIKLLEVKDIKSITVKELTDAADVNRSTFYFYYEDVFDMVKKMQEEIYEVFLENVVQSKKKVETVEDYVDYVKRFFDFCRENEMQCRFVLNNDINNELMQKIKKAVMQNVPDSTMVFPKTSPAHYLTAFAVSGITGTVIAWLEDGMFVSSQEMAEFISATYAFGAQTTKKSEI